MTEPGSDPASESATVVLRMHAAGERVFGRYALVRQLGRGGMGIVWLAHDSELDEDVALKFLPELLASDRAAVDDLRRETRRSRELTHPHIIRVHDFLRDERNAAIAMEFVDGDTLSNLRLAQPSGVFEPQQLAAWVNQAAEALDYAHTRARIVHRDLKAANLMVDRRGDLKVADFGISATVSETVTRVSRMSTSGTPVYMSPQQMRGSAPSPADDIYSLGATLFELLTGKPPFFRGDISHQVINVAPPTIAQRRTEFGLPATPIPPIWEQTIAACLAKDPDSRPATAGSVAAALGTAATGGEPTVVHLTPSSPAAPIPPPTEKAPSTHGTQPVEPLPPVPVHESAPKSNAGLYAAIGLVAAGLLAVAFYLGLQISRKPGATPAEISQASVPAQPADPTPASPPDTDNLAYPSSVAADAPPQDAAPSTIRPSEPSLPATSSPPVSSASSANQTPSSSIRFTPPAVTPPSKSDDTPPAPGVASSSGKPSNEQTFWTPPDSGKPSGSGKEAQMDDSALPSGSSESTTRPIVDARGGVIIESTPSGAEVLFGGTSRETTPTTFRDLRVGQYQVIVRKTGYEDWVQDVQVEENRFASIRATLVRTAGSVRVTSVPSGLSFAVSGQGYTQRGTTPATLENVPAGSYTVQVLREGWDTQQFTANVAARQTANVAAEFTEGTISFTSRPAGASVRVTGGALDRVAFNNDKGQESVTPFIGRVKPGSYQVEFSLAGYEAVTEQVTVDAKRTVSADAQLKRAREQPAGASFSISDLRLDMVWLAPGTFTMGSPNSEPLREKDEGPLTDVTLSHGFWIGRQEVTQAQWQSVMGAAAGRTRGAQPNEPVQGVTWDEAMAFCRRLTERERSAGRLPSDCAYTLPTEAQWEYACRAGSQAAYAGTGRVDDMGWYISNSRGRVHPVGMLRANAWGLQDMHGNVSEWCQDIYVNRLPGGTVIDPRGPASGTTRVLRGGNWGSYTMLCRSADRVGAPPTERKPTNGFRVVLSRVN